MTKTEEFISGIRTAAWRTSGARFNSSRRLKRRDWVSTFSIAIFSAFGIAIAIAQKVYSFQAGAPIDNYVTALSICIGLFVIIISLIEWGANNSVKAEALYRNAEELNEFQRELNQFLAEVADGREQETDPATRFREKYEHIKIRCPYNHEPVDDLLFLAQYRTSPEFADVSGKPRMSLFEATWARTAFLFSSVWYFFILWLIIFALLWKVGAAIL